MLFELGSGGFLLIKSQAPCCLQVMSQGKAERYFKALTATDLKTPPGFTDKFARHQRVVCTDADGAVDRAELAHAAADPRLAVLKTKCETQFWRPNGMKRFSTR